MNMQKLAKCYFNLIFLPVLKVSQPFMPGKIILKPDFQGLIFQAKPERLKVCGYFYSMSLQVVEREREWGWDHIFPQDL